MIVPMKKVSLFIRSSDRTKALKVLRKTGLMHIQISEGHGEKLQSLNGQVSLIESSMFTLSEIAKKAVQKECNTEEALEIAKEVARICDEKKELEAKLSPIQSELDRLSDWGKIDPAELEFLKERGITLSLYEMPLSEFKKLDSAVRAIVLHKEKSSVRFAAVGDENDSIALYKTALPSVSTDELEAKLRFLRQKVDEINANLAELSCYCTSMKAAVRDISKKVEFETFKTGMDDENLSSNEKNDATVAYFVGYTEEENLERIKTIARENSFGIVISDPTEEDDVPTKLKNNRFVSLIYPLTDFLGTVPGYFEYDISAWFLTFILIFFGIIFGDGGYGLFILAVAAVPIITSFVKKKEQNAMFLLIALFGLSTILWGTLTCTWFGLDPKFLPGWLKGLSVPFISNVYADKLWQPPWVSGNVGLTTSQNLQIFCFAIALIQLSVAHIKGAVRNKGSLKLLGDIGSILQLCGIFYLVLSLVVNGEVFSFGLVIGGVPIGTVSIALIGIGFVMSFVFSNYEGSIGKSILDSLKNIVSVLLGVVNVFSDIVSYIRLWAVGLAGAAISSTVNELASPFIGNFLLMIIAIVLLIFGHGLNMILNVLSVIVHGIRLNTLEFSSHLDMSWSGHKFKPFEE